MPFRLQGTIRSWSLETYSATTKRHKISSTDFYRISLNNLAYGCLVLWMRGAVWLTTRINKHNTKIYKVP